MPWREHGPAAPHEVGGACAAGGVPTKSLRQIIYTDAR